MRAAGVCLVLAAGVLPLTALASSPPDESTPPSSAPETTEPETTVPETTVPETTEPDSTEPESTVPESTEPDATVPETTEPDEGVPDAEIDNDEGGPVTIVGSVEYSNPFFLAGVAEPIVILEDQAGFIDRDRGFVMSQESQVLAQLTSDVDTSPFSYVLSLPDTPRASLRDVDHDDVDEDGVMVYAIAYWTNTWGDPYLEERDLYGGGWSTAYVSTRTDPNPSAGDEVIGGTYLVFAPDDEQSFPSGFGPDGLLFTDDDPIVDIPAGYTVVNLDTETFTFDRSREVTIDLIEGEAAALADFSQLSYTDAFDEMVETFRTRYAFSELKEIDWDAKSDEFRPRFEEAEADRDVTAYVLALRDFLWSIPDVHIGLDNLLDYGPVAEMFVADTDGGIGIAIREVTDGRALVTHVTAGSPAAEAGIELRAELITIDGRPVGDVVGEVVPWSSPFSTPDFERLQQLRYAMRFEVDSDVEITYQNPGETTPTTVTLTAVPERESFESSSFNVGLTGAELPVDFELLDSGYVLATVYSFFDNDLLTIQLWERMVRLLNDGEIPGLIIDMRQNGGGSGFLADQMAAYFFDERLDLGHTAYYDESLGYFYGDPRQSSTFIPPPEDLRFHGPVAVLVGPSCVSACEFFSYDMTIEERAEIVGHYPTAGGGGAVEVFLMPEGARVRFTIGRGLDADGQIHIEGQGVAPTIDVPVTEESLFSDRDPLLDAALKYLDAANAVDVVEGGAIAPGDSVTGSLTPGTRVQYTLDAAGGDVITITLGDETGELDTYLRVYDTAGNLLAENDDADGGDTVNSELADLEIPEDMTLIVEVGTYDDAGDGLYRLTVTSSDG